MFLVSQFLDKPFICSHCQGYDFKKEQNECTMFHMKGVPCETCNDFQKLTPKTFMDFYAIIYYFYMKNYEYYITQKDHYSHYEKISKGTLIQKWDHHLRSTLTEYLPNKKILTETYEMAVLILSTANCKEELIILIGELLLKMDKYLCDFKEDLIISYKPAPVSTIRGELIYKCHSKIIEYINTKKKKRTFNQNKNSELRYYITNFYLKEKTSSYSVSLGSLNFPDFSNIKDFRFGFIPGNFLFTRYLIEDYPEEDGTIRFIFKDVHNKEDYFTRTKNNFAALHQNKCNLIMLPELFSPLQLQNEIIETLKTTPNVELQLAIMGSFHIPKKEIYPNDTACNDYIYNYAKIVTGEGKKIYDLFKSNQFVLEKNEEYKGSFEKFQKCDGKEKNAIDELKIQFFDSSLGRIAFLICMDFLVEKAKKILVDWQVDIIFVLAMTPNAATGKFQAMMRELGTQNDAMVIVCNNFIFHEMEGTSEVGVAIYIPGEKKVFQCTKEVAHFSLEEIVHEILSVSSLGSKEKVSAN